MTWKGLLVAGSFILPALFGAPVLSQDLDAQIKSGKTAYDQLCGKCHGKDMVNPGTGSFDLRKFPLDQKQRFYDSVNNGRGDMPAWADVLFDGELDAIWAYVATKGGTRPMPEKSSAAHANDALTDLMTPGHLTVCLARNGGALSGKRSSGGVGLDYRTSKALAEALDLELSVTWFETEPEEENDPVRETYAMLALPLCDLVASHPLYEGSFGEPKFESAAPPRWDDMPDNWGHKQVDVAPISITEPYMRAEIGLVAGPGFVGAVNDLAELSGHRVAYQQGTLSGAILTAQAPQAVIDEAKTFNPGPTFLWEIENGEADVAIVDVAAYDFHRRQNSITKLRLLDWRHPIGFNIGFAVLTANDGLKQNIDRLTTKLVASDQMRSFAEEDDITYAQPKVPFVSPALTLSTLRSLR
ncbi:MAG: c-type cytochrome [Pseudomonadota bacterium]